MRRCYENKHDHFDTDMYWVMSRWVFDMEGFFVVALTEMNMAINDPAQ